MTTDMTSNATERFPSLAAMRARHRELLSLGSDASSAAERNQSILEFLETGRRTGAVLQSRADRSAAQSLLDYWVGVLVTAPMSSMDEFVSEEDILLIPFDSAAAPDLSNKRCPYIGLAAFLETDADRFYGREEAVQTLTNKVIEQSIVIVTGASGSGKSSLVLAGLLPALKACPADVTGGWIYLPVAVPGSEPIGALLRVLCPTGLDPRVWSTENRKTVIGDPASLSRLVGRAADAPAALLVVDQFEELFTLCDDQKEREAYAAAMVSLLNGPGKFRIVLTVREDYLRQTAQLPALQQAGDNPESRFSPPAMSARELRRVIEQPAALVGLTFDEGIVDDLVKEVSGEPTALPLLQFTLLKLWENKDRNRISWDSYRRVGSPREALKRTADGVYRQLAQELDRKAAKLVFLELVQPSVGVEFVRRRIRRQSLQRIASTVTVDGVLERFTAAGLIRMTPGVDPEDDRFEVAHEALIRNWPLLAEWLETKRQQSAKEIQLAATARLWIESGRDGGYLLTGDALTDAMRYAETSPEIGELVGASQAADGQRKTKERWILTSAITVLAMGCVALGLTTVSAMRSAKSARDYAKKANDQTVAATAALDESEKQKAIAKRAEETVRLQLVELQEEVRKREAAQLAANVATERASEYEQKAVKNARTATDLTEQIVQLSSRPALLVCGDRINDAVPQMWSEELRANETEIGKTLRSTGLITLTGNPNLKYPGTAFVVGKDVVLTPAFVARTFCARGSGGNWKLADGSNGQPAVYAGIEFNYDKCQTKLESYQIVKVLFFDQSSIALLQTAPLPDSRPPLSLADVPPTADLKERPVFAVGYLFPYLQESRFPKEVLEGILRGVPGVKRLSPGRILGITEHADVSVGEVKGDSEFIHQAAGRLLHDCTTMGGSAGSPLVDLQLGKVIGVHVGGELKVVKENHAIPMWGILSNDRVRTILERAGREP